MPLSSHDVARAVAVPPHSLRRWVRDGLLRPTPDPADGRGTLQWTERDAREASVVASLRSRLTLSEIRRVLVALRNTTTD